MIIMGNVISGMSMSLDGYINDQNGSVEKLYPDFDEMHHSRMLKDAIKYTGAVVMGRHAFEMSKDPDWYAGNYEFQTPIFVLTHTIPEKHPKETGKLTFTFVTDGIESAISQAKTAAGEKDVQVIGGASTFQQCLNAKLCDEVQLDIIPVIIGGGLKLFENIDFGNIKLDRVGVEMSTSVRTTIILRLIGKQAEKTAEFKP